MLDKVSHFSSMFQKAGSKEKNSGDIHATSSSDDAADVSNWNLYILKPMPIATLYEEVMKTALQYVRAFSACKHG